MVRPVRHWSDERDNGRRAKSLLYDPHTFYASQEQVNLFDILTSSCLYVIVFVSVFVTVFVSVLKTANRTMISVGEENKDTHRKQRKKQFDKKSEAKIGVTALFCIFAAST